METTERMENKHDVKRVSSQNTSSRNNVSIPTKPVFLPSQLSSYKGIIIAVCLAILAWMLLRWDNRHAFKDANKSIEKEDKTSFLDKTRDNIKNTINEASANIKNSYQHTSEIVNDKMQDTVDKVKKTGHKEEKKNTIQDNVKDSINNAVKKTKETIESLKDKSQETIDSLKDKSQETVDAVKDKSQQTLDAMKDKSQQTLDAMKDKSQQTIDKLKETSQTTIDKIKGTTPPHTTMDTIKETSQATIDTIKVTSQATMDKIKETFLGTHANVENRFDMSGLIEQAHSTLTEFLSPHLSVEEQIPSRILSGAKAIVFVTIVKGGVGISGSLGTGIVIARTEKGKWSGPCAIRLAGVDIGLNIGIEKSDHIIILRDDAAVRTFGNVGQLKLGLDAAVAAGPKGRDASIALSISDKGYSTSLSYSMAKGAYLGLSFEGQIITIRNDCNEQYYGKKVDAKDILERSVKPPKNKILKKIYKMIDSHSEKKVDSDSDE